MKQLESIPGLILVGIMLICPTSTAFAEANENGNTILSIEDGAKIASFYALELSQTIPELTDWNNSVVEHAITYYDLNGDKTAYAYVIENNEFQGYILISATKDNYPILEFSKGKLPHMKSEINEKSQGIVQDYATENSLSVEESIPIYEGATFYYNEYKMKDKQSKSEKKILVDLSKQKVIDITEVASSDLAENLDTTKAQDIQKAWKDLDARMAKHVNSKSSFTVTSSIGYIYDVPFELWYLGCAPTSAAMVLEYWDENGYSGLPYGDPLIEDLADAMGTTAAGSTSISMIDDGIEDVCSDYGYANFNAINDGSLTMAETKNEINADRPFVLSMLDGGIGSGYTQPYNDHAVTCVGYSDGTTDYVFLHDTWDDEDHHYITFGNWDSATATWVRP